MATFTANYNLRKPADGDFVTVSSDINASMDTIDAELDDHEDRLDAIEGNIDGAWTSYTPTLTNITLGNGTLTGRWKKLGSKTIVGSVLFIAGSTTSYSAGNLSFGLPPSTPRASYDSSVDTVGYGNVNNNSAATREPVILMPNVGFTAFLMSRIGGLVTNTVPFAFGTASRIGFQFMYEIA